MSYLGNSPPSQNFVAGADQFSGTGSQTVFTLSRNVNTVFDIFVTVANVPQDPFTAYTVAGNTLTFDGAPASGTNNIDVVYRATNVQTFVPSPGVSAQFGLGSAASPSITFIGDTNTGIYSPAADTIAFAEGGAEVARFDSAGNFGLGTSTPDSLTNFRFLDVGSSGTNQGVVQASNGTSKVAIYANGNTGALATRTNHNLLLQTNATTAITIDTSQNVGIGTSSPGARLNIDGAAADAVVLFTNNGTASAGGNGLRVGIDNSLNAYVNNTKAGPLLFYTSNSERARIDANGQMRTTNGAGAVALAYDARAWVNFNGTGTVAIRASGNVSSITDNGTGNYTINFTTAMPDANYAVTGMSSRDNSGAQVGLFTGTTNTTSSCGIIELAQSSFFDVAVVTVAIFR